MKSIGIWDEYDWDNWKKIFINFMGSYFNMDSDNIYEDLKDYIRGSNSDNKLRILTKDNDGDTILGLNSIKKKSDGNDIAELFKMLMISKGL